MKTLIVSADFYQIILIFLWKKYDLHVFFEDPKLLKAPDDTNKGPFSISTHFIKSHK